MTRLSNELTRSGSAIRDPISFEDCDLIWTQSRRRKLGHNTYLERDDESAYHVRLHATRIVTFHRDGRVELNSGGWRTVTTKERMNRYLPSGWRLYQDAHVWYVAYASDWDWTSMSRWYYGDGLCLDPEHGTYAGADYQLTCGR